MGASGSSLAVLFACEIINKWFERKSNINILLYYTDIY